MSAEVSTIWLSCYIRSYQRAKFQRFQLLVTVQSNLSGTLKWQVQDRKFLLPLGWQKRVWSSKNQNKVCSWILQFHLVILFFKWWILLHIVWSISRKTVLSWKMKKGPSIFWMKIYVFNSARCMYIRHKCFWLENSTKTILFFLGCLRSLSNHWLIPWR